MPTTLNGTVAKEQPHIVAKRGILALVERRQSYMSLRDGHHEWRTYTPAIVAAVTRDGTVKAVRLAGQDWPLKARDWISLIVDSSGKIADPVAVAGRLVDENGRAVEYQDQTEAVAAIKAAAGMVPEASAAPATDRAALRLAYDASRPALASDTRQPKPTSAPPRRRRNGDVRPREYLTEVEVDRLMAAARKRGRYGARDAAMILIAYRHGLRVGELVAVRWDQVDLANGHLHVNRLKHGVASVHPLSGLELRLLREIKRGQAAGSRYVFTTERGAPFTTNGIHKMLARTGIAAGFDFPVHPHMLRHGTGYKLANDGRDTRSIQLYLGHRQIQHTTRYTELAPGRFNDFWRD